MIPSVAIGVGHYLGEETREIEYPANEKTAGLLHSILSVNGAKAEVFTGKLPEKVAAINRYEPDIAIDIHYNRLHWPHRQDKFGSGYEVCVWQGSTWGTMLALKILEGFFRRLPFDRRGLGVWERKDLYFLKHTSCPAVVPEPLFLDNPFEVPFLKTNRGYEFVATAIFSGITEYFKERSR